MAARPSLLIGGRDGSGLKKPFGKPSGVCTEQAGISLGVPREVRALVVNFNDCSIEMMNNILLNSTEIGLDWANRPFQLKILYFLIYSL